MDFSITDIVLGVILLFFMISGFKSGFVKKIFGLVGLALALILATKFSADLSELVFQSMGLEGKIGFAISFISIVILVIILQAVIYKSLVHELVENTWNRIGGILLGFIEGGIVLSIALILLSVYFQLPNTESKANSILYKPIKNFAPLVYDSINTLLPESEDFYQELLKNATEGIKKVEEKLK